jgi:hypothetical protein
MTKIDVLVLPDINEDGLIAPGVPTVEDFRSRAADVADSITEIAQTVQARLDAGDQEQHSARWAMDSAQLSFQMALQAGAGVVIAKATASATFSIQITWKRSH